MVQSKQMKMNVAPHLAGQLELNETHLLIHMVAQSDMAATRRAMSAAWFTSLIASCCKCALDREEEWFNCKVKLEKHCTGAASVQAFMWTLKP